MQYHTLTALLPLMEGDDFEDLTDDIREHGLLEPIWTLGADVIIDGRNRHRACLAAGIEPTYREWQGDEDGVLAFVLSQNLHRRHLSTSQRAMLAAKVLPLLREMAEQRQQASRAKPGERVGSRKARLNSDAPTAPSQPAGRATSQAARMAGVSTDSVEKAAKVQEQGTEQLRQAVAGGTVSVHQAAQLTELPPEMQAAAIAAAEAAPRTPERDPARVWRQVERTVAKLRRQCRHVGLSPEEALVRFPEKPDSRRAKKAKPEPAGAPPDGLAEDSPAG